MDAVKVLLVYFGGILALFAAAMLTTVPDEKLYKTAREQAKYFLVYTVLGVVGLLLMYLGAN